MLNRENLFKKVIAKLDAQKIYESKIVRDLMHRGMDLFPNYNLDNTQAMGVIEFVFKHIDPKYRTQELADKIHSGIT